MERLQKAAAFGARMGKKAATLLDTSIGKGIMLGGGLGALGGGLLGAINPGNSEELETEGDASKRRYYLDDYNKKQTYYVDDYGNPVFKRRGILSGAIDGGLSGLGMGALLGGIVGGIAGPARASGGASPGRPAFPRDVGNIAPSGTASSPLTDKLTLKPETSTNLTLRPLLDDAYKSVPGGLDKAVSEAQKHQSAALDSGLITWKPSDLDVSVPVSNKSRDWDASKPRDSQYLGGITLSKARSHLFDNDKSYMPSETRVLINPTSYTAKFGKPEDQRMILGHEMTHAALHGGVLRERPVLSSSDLARISGDKASTGMDHLKYLADPEEFKAHLAEIKRESARNGILLDTVEKARKALNDARDKPGRDVLRNNLPALMKNKTFMDKAILQLLSIVKGNTMKPRGTYA